MRTLKTVVVILGSLGILAARQNNSSRGQSVPATPSLLTRHYQEGEKLSYHMTATNKDNASTKSYQAQADAVVKKDAAGNFYEEYQWSHVVWDGRPAPAVPDFRQVLSLDPRSRPQLPDLQRAGSALVGPTLDLFTFYTDLTLALRHPSLNRAGDHIYVKVGGPNSWAAGEGLILGEDSIDFDITLQSVDRSANTATLLVRHVPPAQPGIHLPAAWMHTPVVDTPNNWVEVGKDSNGKYRACVGKETFDDLIKINLSDGRVLSATMDNPVEVLERRCTDAALTTCGDPIRYEIRRQIEIKQTAGD